jgi:hypothetical protein
VKHLLTRGAHSAQSKTCIDFVAHYAKDAPMRDLAEHDEFDCYPAICDVTRKDCRLSFSRRIREEEVAKWEKYGGSGDVGLTTKILRG